MQKLIQITFIAVIIGVSFSQKSFGQKDKSGEVEKLVQAQKIAFFTDKIGLTPEEAEKFWPIYNEYWEKKNKIYVERKKTMNHYSENVDKLSDSQLSKLSDKYISFETREAQLLKEYHSKFTKILPIEKVMKIYLADYEFKAYLLKKLRNSGKEN
jgi:hypothetical protein